MKKNITIGIMIGLYGTVLYCLGFNVAADMYRNELKKTYSIIKTQEVVIELQDEYIDLLGGVKSE